MSTLLAWRTAAQKLYSRYSQIIIRVVRFFFALLVISQINTHLSFMETPASGLITFILAVICAFFSLHLLVLVSTALIGVQLYNLSIPVMAVTLLLFLIIYILFLRLSPKWVWLVLAVPLAYVFNIPFAVPVLLALVGTPVLVFSLFSGTMIYYILQYIVTTSADYGTEGVDNQGILDMISQLTRQLLDNREMWAMAAVLAVILLIVYGLRRQSFRWSWKIAIAVGVIAIFVANWLTQSLFEVSFPGGIAASVFIAAVLGVLFEFLFFNLRYIKTQRLQFEDNQFYYYVKAIPKIAGAGAPRGYKATTRKEAEFADELDEFEALGYLEDDANEVDDLEAQLEEQATMVIDAEQLRQATTPQTVKKQRTPRKVNRAAAQEAGDVARASRRKSEQEGSGHERSNRRRVNKTK